MRKVKDVKVDLEGRDHGKVFVLTEMSASRAEKWATRALLMLTRSGLDIPEELVSAGMAAIAIVGLRALSRVDFVDAEPLMDEMMGCVQIKPDPARPMIIRDLIEDDIEEVATRLFLRKEVFELHVGFSMVDAVSESTASAETIEPTAGSSSTTSMFRRRSAR